MGHLPVFQAIATDKQMASSEYHIAFGLNCKGCVFFNLFPYPGVYGESQNECTGYKYSNLTWGFNEKKYL